MRPDCHGCSEPKIMSPGLILCGCFAWKIMHCDVCNDILFEHKADMWGYRLTHWLNRDHTTILSIPVRI